MAGCLKFSPVAPIAASYTSSSLESELTIEIWIEYPLLDQPTNVKRESSMRNRDSASDQDLVNVMVFYCKLTLRRNDLVYGPAIGNPSTLAVPSEELDHGHDC
ncbi:hypothetical protein LQW54_013079 [Pestalotiopsis sp. IQ-011]